MSTLYKDVLASSDAVKKLAEALNDLGETPEQVAASLLAQGCQGTPRRACDCPLAKYLTRVHGSHVSVGATFAGIVDANGKVIPVVLPSGAYNFRVKFDQELFPELIR